MENNFGNSSGFPRIACVIHCNSKIVSFALGNKNVYALYNLVHHHYIAYLRQYDCTLGYFGFQMQGFFTFNPQIGLKFEAVCSTWRKVA